jgi:glycosyltransferase involved in cell wall biosynthesis
MLFRKKKPVCGEAELRRFDAGCFADSPERRFGERAAALRRELGIAPEDNVLLSAGAFEPEQRVAVLLDQFLEFRRAGSGAQWRLVLAGEGAEGPLLHRMAGNDPNVHFLSPDRAELPVLFRLADLVALVSRADSGCATVRGAMASGRPVLVSDGVGCAARLVEPGKTGWCVDSAHPELWFDYPKAASRARLREMGEAASRRI